MKKARNFFWIILMLIIVSCQKKEVDYREQYVGAYNFTTISYLKDNYYIDGEWHSEISNDTINYNGIIEKYENNKLKIIFLPNSTEPNFDEQFFPIQINGLIYPEISSSDSITYSDLQEIYGWWCFDGYFKGDSIFIRYFVEYHVGSQGIQIFGLKQ